MASISLSDDVRERLRKVMAQEFKKKIKGLTSKEVVTQITKSKSKIGITYDEMIITLIKSFGKK